MGSFVFKWSHPASDVYVTGTFDNWEKSERLSRVGDHFEKDVTLPRADEKFYYKFVVDGNWVTDHTAPQEHDYAGNLNNVLTTDRIVKHSSVPTRAATTDTTSNMASAQRVEETGSSDLPGAYPETPAADNTMFNVDPISASTGAANPVKLTPGEPVPRSDFHPAAIKSAVQTDKASYEDGSGDSFADLQAQSKGSEQTFGVSPLPATSGAGNPAQSELTANTISSTARTDKASYDDASGTTFADLQAQSKGSEQTFGVNPIAATGGAGNPTKLGAGESVPHHSNFTANTVQSTATTDKASYEHAGGSAPVLPPVVTPEAERAAHGDGILGASILGIGALGAGSYSASGLNSKGLSGDGKNFIPESSLPIGTSGTESYDASPLMQSAGANTTTARLAGAVPLEPKGVPEVVKASQHKAGVEPEASAIPSEVAEKSAFEKELLAEVPKAPATSEGALPTIQSAGVNTTTSKLAGAVPLEKKATVPETVKESQHTAGVDPEASGIPSEVQEKSAVEKELLSEVPKAPVTSDGTVLHSEAPLKVATGVSAGEAAAAVGAATLAVGGAVGAAVYATKDKIVANTQGAQSYLPTSIQESISGINSQSRFDSKQTAASSVPDQVSSSLTEAHQSPEAAAYAEPVAEKKAMEKQLLSEVKPVNPTGGSASSGLGLGSTTIGPITDHRDPSGSHNVASPSKSGLGPVNDARGGVASGASSSAPKTSTSEAQSGTSTSAVANPVTGQQSNGLSTKNPIFNSQGGSSEASTALSPDPTTSGTTASPADASKATSTGLKTAGAVGASSAATAAAAAAYNKSAKNASAAPVSASAVPNSQAPNRQSLIAPALKAPADSRDVSPGTVPGSHEQTAPIVTSGIQSATTATQSSAPVVTTGIQSATTATQSSAPKAPTTPTKQANRSSGIYADSPASSTATDKKSKRKSLFGRIKDKLSSKDKA